MGVTFTVGGSVSNKTIQNINIHYKELKKQIYKLETRRVNFLDSIDAIRESLKFEKLYILSKKRI
ncbi:hypothetical protein P3258_07075 [Campylobacter jejuni]|nr:hypothetical protein P3258_07075 [Campylobacter jejuni]